jgi:hypothetical protein
MKHKKVLKYEMQLLLFCDAPFFAGFGPGSGVSAVVLVDRASKQRGPMQRVTDNSTSATGDRRRQLMPLVLLGHEISETTLPKSAWSVSVETISAFPTRRLKFTCSRFALHLVLLLQSFSSATLLHNIHIHFILVFAIMDQLQQHAQAGKSARLPSFVNDLVPRAPRAPRAPPAGVFSANELLWTKVRDRGGICNVVAIPKDRIHDFVGGENERDNTTINMEVKSSQQCPGVPTSLVGRCCYGRLRKTAQKEKAATTNYLG